MKSILFGNGLNIKFNKSEYSNDEILKRGLKFVKMDEKMQKICPPETLNLLDAMFQTVPDIVAGCYDAVARDCIKELAHFKANYSNKNINNVGQIGIEDYFLVIHLIYSYNRSVNNTDGDYNVDKEKSAQECYRALCLAGIYNLGAINKLYTMYSDKFIEYINSFDEVFTTNYDSNLDSIYFGEVQHIHGKFDELHELYDPNSFRNSLSDDQFTSNNLINIRGYEYLHSTALMSYSGINKFKKINNVHNLNKLTIEQIRAVPEGSVKEKDRELAIEAKEAIEKDSSLRFQEYDAYNKFKNLKGDITIVGLSAANDNHIFRQIDNLNIYFYYFSNADKELATEVLPSSAKLENVEKMWEIL
ncbi:hypothetical protein LABALGNA3A7_06800 [Dellaglioa algida]|nr:hypothetical protein LABALGNA3A7_06800 [Dellaglioa algida]